VSRPPRRPAALPDPRVEAQTRLRYAALNLVEHHGGRLGVLPWRMRLRPGRITVDVLAGVLHDLGYEVELRAVPAGPPAAAPPAEGDRSLPTVPGVAPDRLARYERLRTGPDARRVADALARDWRAVGGYLRTAMDRVDRQAATPARSRRSSPHR
jgi:hypothetical protein